MPFAAMTAKSASTTAGSGYPPSLNVPYVTPRTWSFASFRNSDLPCALGRLPVRSKQAASGEERGIVDAIRDSEPDAQTLLVLVRVLTIRGESALHSCALPSTIRPV